MPKLRRMSSHDKFGWKSQFDRMCRWYDRIQQNQHEDFIYAFFQNCYILRDWLLHDEVITKDEWETFIQKFKCIQLCRDLCNGTKHGQLRPADMNRNPITGLEWSSLEDTAKSFVIIDFEKVEPVKLAKECIEAWKTILPSP
ncbi:MAG TPA: hypothetical protein V6C86_22980 [Oculatellaceae cyanobacterium]